MSSSPAQPWERARIRFKARVNPKATVDLETSTQVSFIPMEAIGDDGSLELDRTRPVGEVSQGYTYFENGDVSIAKITPCFENGKGAVMDGLFGGVGFGTTELIVLRPEEEISPRFLYYVTQSNHFRAPGEAAMLGSGGQKRVPDLFVKDFEAAWPDKNMQIAIASYLGAETARIDALIEEKERVMEVLLSAVTSLASRCLQIPENEWIRLEHITDLTERPVHQLPGCTYTKLGLFNRGRGIFKKYESEQEDMGESDFFWVEPGDLVISGQFAWEGAVALATEEHAGCVVSHRFPVVRGKRGAIMTEYLFALLASKHGDFLLNDCSRGSAGRNRPLNMRSLLKWKIPVPSMEEQAEIARLVRLREQVRFSNQKTIELLKELRAATITDAVLGRIDVRAHMKN